VRSPFTASAMAVSISSARSSMRVRASTSPSPTRRLLARRMRRTNAAYSLFSTWRRGRFDVNLALTLFGWKAASLVDGAGGLVDDVQRTLVEFVLSEHDGGGSFRATWLRRRGASSDSCRKPPGRVGLSRVALAPSPRRRDRRERLDRPALAGYTIGSG
jgi:hypothetical protein